MEDLAIPADSRMAIEELVRGRDFANQLRQVIIRDDDDDDGSATATPFAQQLVKNVLRSFTNTLFLLDKYPTYESQEVSQTKVTDSCFMNPTKSEDSQESCKSSIVKERRGCCRRRRTSQTWEKESETPTVDGHQWRKYGQKVILNFKYSRNYYRCTHKFDQGCQATKHEQRVQDEPPLYRTTYYGHHTCRNLLSPEIILDSTSPFDSSILLSFDNTFPNPAKQDCPFLSSSFPSSSVKKACKVQIPSSSVEKECKVQIPSSSSNDYMLSPEPTLDNFSRHVNLSSTLESDHRDVMSGVLYDSLELDDVLEAFIVGF